MTTATANRILLAAPKEAPPPPRSQIVAVARRHGVSPLRQLREMMALRYVSARLDLREYYMLGLFDPAIPMTEKRRHLGVAGNIALNDRLSPPALTVNRAFVRDKVLHAALLRQMGLPTTRTQAVVTVDRGFGLLPTLRNADDIRAFLLDEAQYPLFGKPCNGVFSVGSVLLVSVDPARGLLTLGNGREVPLAEFCEEVIAAYPDGYQFQHLLRQHRDIAAVTGRAVGTIRVVTVRETERPAVLYSVWKIPSPAAASDSSWQDGSMVAAVTHTGQVGRCRTGAGVSRRWIEEHPVSGRRFDRVSVPCWSEIRRVACDAHTLFPEFGIIGWDIAVTPEGPVIVECSDNPDHGLYQLAHGRGILNDDFRPVFDRVAARSESMLRNRIALHQARETARRR